MYLKYAGNIIISNVLIACMLRIWFSYSFANKTVTVYLALVIVIILLSA